MPLIRRKDSALNDAIENLDAHFELHKGNAKMAYQAMSNSQRKFVEAEIAQCVLDPRYYLENYHCIKSEDQGIHTLYPFWDAQEIFFDHIKHAEYRANYTGDLRKRFIVLKARQLGISTWVQGYMFFRTIFTEASNSLIVAHEDDAANHIFSMSRLAYDYLPWWMRPQERYNARGRFIVFDKKDDRERRMSPGLQSGIYVEAANAMTGVAIGTTMRNAHLTELSKWRYGGHILSTQILPTMNASDLFAVLESTARGKDGFWYGLWVDCIEGRLTQWTPVFIPWFKVRKYSLPLMKDETFERTEEEHAVAKKAKEEYDDDLTDEQLNWRRNKWAETRALNNGDDSMAYQEYPQNWRQAFQASGLCAFNKKKLMRMLELDAMKPIFYGEISLNPENKRPVVKLTKMTHRDEDPPPQVMAGGRLYVWELPTSDQNGQPYEYYIGADVAMGIEGGDFSCAHVMRVGRGQQKDVQVAEWHGWINPIPYAHVLAALGYYYHTAQISCEINECGRDVNAELMRAVEYPNLYRWKHLDKIKNFMTDFVGFQTTSRTRPSIIRAMRESVEGETIVLRSEALIDQMLTFGAIEDGSRIEGMGDHDDRVMAAQICLYCAHELEWGSPRFSREEIEELKRDPNVDYANTDFSPVHDKPGVMRDLHQRGIPPEAMLELQMYNQMSTVDGRVPEDEQWKLM